MAFTQVAPYLELASQSVTPGSGKQLIYPKTDGKWYVKNAAGTETLLGGGGTANAPADATYIVNSASSGLSAEILLSTALASPPAIGGTAPAAVTATTLALGSVFTPSNILGIDGQATRKIAMERNTTSNTAGNTFQIASGGATVGATDKGAGDVNIAPGITTGLGVARVRIRRMDPSDSTGTSDNSAADAWEVPSTIILANNSTTGIIDIPLTTLTAFQGQIEWGVYVKDATNVQSFTGIVTFAAVNKAAAYTMTVTEDTANEAKAVSSGTVTCTWTLVSGTNKVTITVNVTSSLTPSTGYPKLFIIFTNNSKQAPTYLL